MNLTCVQVFLVGFLGIWMLSASSGTDTFKGVNVDNEKDAEKVVGLSELSTDEPPTEVGPVRPESSMDVNQVDIAKGPNVTCICGQVFGLQDHEKMEALVTLNFGMRVAYIDKFGGYCFSNVPVGRYIVSVVHSEHEFLDVLIRIRNSDGKFYSYQTYHHVHVKPNEVFFTKLYHKPYISPRQNQQYNVWRLFFKPYIFLTLFFIFTLSLPKTISYRNYNNIRVGTRTVGYFKDQLPKRRKLSMEDYVNGLRYSYILSRYSYFREDKDDSTENKEESDSADSVDSVESLEHNTEDYANFNYNSIKESDFTSPFLNSLLKAAKFWGSGYNWTRSTRIVDY